MVKFIPWYFVVVTVNEIIFLISLSASSVYRNTQVFLYQIGPVQLYCTYL